MTGQCRQKADVSMKHFIKHRYKPARANASTMTGERKGFCIWYPDPCTGGSRYLIEHGCKDGGLGCAQGQIPRYFNESGLQRVLRTTEKLKLMCIYKHVKAYSLIIDSSTSASRLNPTTAQLSHHLTVPSNKFAAERLVKSSTSPPTSSSSCDMPPPGHSLSTMRHPCMQFPPRRNRGIQAWS
jgi:hypothetical protein